MDEQQMVTANTTGGSGSAGTTATSGGNTATIGNTGEEGMTGTTGGTTGTLGGIPSYAGTTSFTGGTGGITGAGGSKCATTAQDACTTDDDCTIGDYRPPILSPADCYCFVCGFPVAKTTRMTVRLPMFNSVALAGTGRKITAASSWLSSFPSSLRCRCVPAFLVTQPRFGSRPQETRSIPYEPGRS